MACDDFESQTSIMFDESRYLGLYGSSGQVLTELLRVDGLSLTLGRVTSTGHEIQLRESANLTFLMPRKGFLEILVSGREYKVVPGRPMVFRPTERRTRASSMVKSCFTAATLQVSMDRMRRLAAACDVSLDHAFALDALAIAGGAGTFLARELPRLVDDIFLRPNMAVPDRVLTAIATLIDEHLCDLLGVAAEQTASRAILPAFHRVRQAEDLMHARSDEAVSITEIAQALNVSLRSLQLAFNEVYDLGPRDVLNRIRLEKARHRLLTASRDSQVTSVALESGFFHLSRFAQSYARVYGERPSETLARRRA